MSSNSVVIWMSEPRRRALLEQLKPEDNPIRVVSSSEELAKQTDAGVIFVDGETLPAVAAATETTPIIAVTDEDPRRTAVSWLHTHGSLCHVMSGSMLDLDLGREHIRNVLGTLHVTRPRLLDWIDRTVRGRRVRLTHSTTRIDRLDRMTEFLQEAKVGDRTIENLRDVAEELLTNAFYDAPVAAGAVRKPISRTQDVVLPEDRACDIAYGCRDDLAMVRVRDPFGSLSRRRIVEVLTRCASTDMDVNVDESMGGAGLGLWRIVTVASFVGISVVRGRHTEVLVGIATKRSAATRPFAFHMFFNETEKRRFWQFVDEDSSPPMNKSVTIMAR